MRCSRRKFGITRLHFLDLNNFKYVLPYDEVSFYNNSSYSQKLRKKMHKISLPSASGAASKVVSDLADCRQYCAEGLGEAELCGDAEGQAHFFLMGAQLNVIEGKSLEHTVSLLEVYWILKIEVELLKCIVLYLLQSHFVKNRV